MIQYLRKLEIGIDGDPFLTNGDHHQFRVVFDVMVNPQNTQSFADIRIYNLSKETAIDRRQSITLSAGYVDNFDLIFTGVITNVLRERDGASTVTRLMCWSGSPADNRGSANASWGANTNVIDVIRDLARSWPMFLDIDESQFDGSPLLTNGFIADGDIPAILDDLSYQFDFDWSVDRGTLVVSRRGRERNSVIFDINQFNGMVGVPEISRGPGGLGVNVTTKINPYIRSTSRINVKSEFATFNTGNLYIQELSGDSSVNGEYNVLTLHYQGDTHGDIWDLSIDALRAGTSSTEPLTISDSGALIWGARVDQEFRARVRQLAENQRLDPNWIMADIAFETGRTFNPAEVNPISGATGLIQFIPSTARGLGTSTNELSRMTAVQQLDYVEKYFEQYSGRIKNIGDSYMAILWPAAIGKPDDFVLWERDGKYARQYDQNAGLDVNRDGKITRGEAVSRVNNMYIEGQSYMR